MFIAGRRGGGGLALEDIGGGGGGNSSCKTVNAVGGRGGEDLQILVLMYINMRREKKIRLTLRKNSTKKFPLPTSLFPPPPCTGILKHLVNTDDTVEL